MHIFCADQQKVNWLKSDLFVSHASCITIDNGVQTGDYQTFILFLPISEKLMNVKQEVGQITHDMEQARKNLNELSKCCGLFLWPWNRLVGAYTLLCGNEFLN